MTISTSEKLKQSIPEIMNIWEKRTLEEVDAAGTQETLALRNSLPTYLSQLSDALSTTIDRTVARKKSDKKNSTRIGKTHGRERANAFDYTMDQMIVEYHILRQVICDVLEKDRTITPIELEVIVCSIEQAVNDAATQFSDTIRELQDKLSQALAHDLRNPLATVKMSAQLIKKQIQDPTACLEKANRIVMNVDRVDRMIQELLDTGKNKHEEQDVTKETTFDLAWLAKDVALEMNISNPDRIQVNAIGECKGRWMEDDIRRLMENLVSNAIKYSYENTPVTITVSQDHEMAQFSVHNIGDPIPEELQPTLFEKFKRAKSAEDKIGWGLGLTVVKEMVESHQGTIEVQSDKKSGTSFIVKIPKVMQEH